MKNKTQHLIPPAYGYRLLLLSLSRVQHFATAWTAAHQGSLPFTIAWSLLKLMSIKSAMPSNHLVLFRTLLNLIPSFPASGSFPMSHLFTSGGQVLEFQLHISPSNEYLRITSFRIDRLDLLAVQGTLKCSPTSQLKSINSSALSFLYSPTHTSIHDYWKNHSFD